MSAVGSSAALLALLAAAVAQSCEPSAQPVVVTREGALRGLAGRTAAGRLFYAFRGIPFAQPPVGELRFQPPQRHHGWPGVRDATEIGSSCLQYNLFNAGEREGDEDCLFANVYTPRLPTGETGGGGVALLPVMVWIHGGGFTIGSGDDQFYGPQLLLDGSVVLVAINYRLNVFGFLSTGDAAAAGNYGLLDQVLALQWVRDNVAAFGGDPALVTIFGESAGGGSVSGLVVSPLAKGLFHHAISQSGSILAAWAAGSKRKSSAERVGELVNCTDSAQLMTCLRNTSALDILESTTKLDPTELLFLPRIDSERGQEALFPEDPRLTLENGRFNLVPWMHGMTEEEGGLFVTQYLMDEEKLARLTAGDLDEWSSAVLMRPEIARLECGIDYLEETAKIRDFYLKDATAPLSKDNMLPLVQVLSDRFMNVASTEEIRLASAHAPVYKFVLDHSGPGRRRIDPLFGIQLPDDYKPMHGEDLTYLFKWRNESFAAADSPEYGMQRFMVDIWTNFARTGRPYTRLFDMPDWPIYTERQQRHMRLNSEPALGERAFEERVRFWHTVRLVEPWRMPLGDQDC